MKKIIASYLIAMMLLWMSWPIGLMAEENGTSSTLAVGENVAQNNASTTPEAAFTAVESDFNNASTTENTFNEERSDDATTTEENATSSKAAELSTQSNEENNEVTASGTIDDAATTTDQAATSTIDLVDTATGTATSTAESAALAAPLVRLSVLAVWQMFGIGSDDDPADYAQFEPSGRYQISKNITICGVASSSLSDGALLAGDSQIEGVYGQMFYPNGVAFGAGDIAGRQGCGQVAAPVCKMRKFDSSTGFDLLCEKIQKGNPALPRFAEESGYGDLCSAEGKLLNETAAVYCCDQELAYDDVAGNYDTGVIARGVDGAYSDMLSSEFAYLPLAKIDVDFANLYYGKVKQGVESLADETISRATARNVGNVPARVTLWQDDMGMGKTGDDYNIRYGARLSGIDSPWTGYEPFETITIPGVIDPGQSVDLDFLVKISNFPRLAMGGAHYSGEMRIETAPVAGYQCKNTVLDQMAGVDAAQNNEKTEAKPEIGPTSAAAEGEVSDSGL